MNRKQNYKWLFSTAVAIASLSALGAPASAQQVRGSFTLPCAVQWGSVRLPSGSYGFETEPNGNRNVLILRGQDRSAFVMARRAEPDNSSQSTLRLIGRGNQARVSSLHIAPAGVTFEYLPSQHAKKEQEAANRSTQQTRGGDGELAAAVFEIPVGTNGQ